MDENDVKRISRLTAIVTYLQTKRLLTAPELARRFGVSVRTIYRDMKALERAGIPVLIHEGKGYTLMEGYQVPPVMFSMEEASALVIAEKLVASNQDASLIKQYSSAISKIKAVLRVTEKEKLELLSDRVAISPIISAHESGNFLVLIQHALTTFKVLEIEYRSRERNAVSKRQIEPFALYYSSQEKWLLIGYCRLRADFRMFRLDRIIKMIQLEQQFEPHQITLKEYLKKKEEKFNTPDIPLS